MKITPIILTLFITLLGCGEETQDNATHGTWKRVSFVNEKTDETLFQDDFHNSSQITIDFISDMRFSGSTTRNTFHGNYSLEDNNEKLIYTSFSTTKVNESDWGNLFYDKIDTSYSPKTKHWESTYTIQDNLLRIYYVEDEHMIFEKQQ